MQMRRIRPVRPAKKLLTKSLNKLKRIVRPGLDHSEKHKLRNAPKTTKDKSQDKQLILGGTRPNRLAFRLYRAFLIPAIPTMIGTFLLK